MTLSVNVYSLEGQKVSSLDISKDIFERPFNESLVHQVIISSLSNCRQGTHKQKTRAEVSGGGIKPWKQKGTGRARAGTIRSPLWRHGGRAFAARLGVYTHKINKKMYRGAICSIFSQLLRDDRIIVVQEFDVEPKTKSLVTILTKLNAIKPLIILNKIDQNVILASRNIIDTNLISVGAIDPVSLLSHEKIVITREAFERLNEVLKND
jgi:large subunit ribosomal protein L4